MKQLIFALTLFGTTLFASAQKKALNVPTAVKAAFTKAHPNVQGKWEKEGADYEVSFKEGGKSKSCNLDASGNILETETTLTLKELPQAVQTTINSKYKNKKITEVASIVKADGTTVYEAEIDKKDILFNANGELVSSTK